MIHDQIAHHSNSHNFPLWPMILRTVQAGSRAKSLCSRYCCRANCHFLQQALFPSALIDSLIKSENADKYLNTKLGFILLSKKFKNILDSWSFFVLSHWKEREMPISVK